MAIQLLRPEFIWPIPMVIIVLWIIIRADFVRAKDDLNKKNRGKVRIWTLISRSIMFSLVLLILAQPFDEVIIKEAGNPRLTILVDESTSMDIFDYDIEAVKQELEKEFPVKIRSVGGNRVSNIGEGILANMEEDDNIILLSDGYNNKGVTLGDVSLVANTLNSTISAFELETEKQDASIFITGPSKTVADVDATFTVTINKVNLGGRKVQISLDGEIIIDEIVETDTLEFTRKLSKGDHRIIAKLIEEDEIADNNIFYKSVTVVDKPKILFISSSADPIDKILDELYEVEISTTLPSDLSPYYTIVLDDVDNSRLNSRVKDLTDYVLKGNGLVALGGFNSFDRGGYKNSRFETLLPVRAGAAKKKKGDSNLVLVIDISGASDLNIQGKKISPLQITKSLAIDIVQHLNLGNKVGVVAFNHQAYRVSELAPLFQNKQDVIDKISRLQGSGQSYFDEGLRGGFSMLNTIRGDKNVILLTDGLAFQGIQDRTKSVVDSLYAIGIKTFVVGVGRSVQHDFLRELAVRGGGIYFPASEANRLKILWGDPEDIEQGQDFSLVILNPNHFITRGINNIDAILNGFNQVLPKDSARQLVVTQSGTPAITIWNYGIGRVATFNVFRGGDLGDLLNIENSLIISRTMNWAIGDPERKNEYSVTIPDTRLEDATKVNVRSELIPVAEGLEFFKVDQNSWESKPFYPNEIGFLNYLDRTFAVNGYKEFQYMGMNPSLNQITDSTGGKIFKFTELEELKEFIKGVSKRTEIKKEFLIWPLIMLLIVWFLVDIIIRKVFENKMAQ